MGRSSFLTRWDRIHNPLKLLIFLLALFPPQNDAVAWSGSDKSALLEFRGSISDPHGFLRSWDSNTSSHCSWAGVFCGSGSRVVALNLTGRGNSSSCAIFGKLSSAVARLTELRVLSIPFNELTGTIPVEIWGMEKLEVLDLEGNSISGALPSEFAGLRSLKILNLGFNEITGGIPRSLSNFLNLRVLNLAGNRMDGTIPGFVGGFGDLNGLYLSFNQFRGSIPDEIGDLSSLLVLNLSFNSLQGPIPSTLGRLKDLRSLSLSANNLTGSIPASLGRLSSLEVLDLSSNSLSGQIPKSIKTLNISTIRRLGASQIDASSSSSNPKDENSNLNSIEIASITSAAAIISVLLALTFLILYTRRQNPGKSRVSMEVITFADVTGGPTLTFESVARNFNASNRIGSGGFGTTYKVEIAPGLLLAVKRLSVGRFQGIQQFHAEIKTLGKLRHPNLVTLIGYHASRAEMFLIYNYLPGGNLEKFIRERPSGALDWRVLHKIALDVSRALSYLHEQCVPRVLHRDVKPSNILLDEECNAYLSDFGLARLLGTSETHATTNVAGTFGYVAPEYAMTCRVSDKADVYSYGVVLLELLSDKKALDPSFSVYGNGFNIVAWAGMLLRKGRAEEFFAAGIWDVGPRDDLVEVLHLAAVCTADSISTRPTMKQVVLRLKQLRPKLR